MENPVIQVIGLPGSGKTFGITQWLETKIDNNCVYLNIEDYSQINREELLIWDCLNFKKQSPVLIESACGIPLDSYIIKLEVPPEVIQVNLNLRSQEPDWDLFYNYLEPAQFTPNKIVFNPDELIILLDFLLFFLMKYIF